MRGVAKLTDPREKLSRLRWLENFSTATVRLIGTVESSSAVGLILSASPGIAPLGGRVRGGHGIGGRYPCSPARSPPRIAYTVVMHILIRQPLRAPRSARCGAHAAPVNERLRDGLCQTATSRAMREQRFSGGAGQGLRRRLEPVGPAWPTTDRLTAIKPSRSPLVPEPPWRLLRPGARPPGFGG